MLWLLKTHSWNGLFCLQGCCCRYRSVSDTDTYEIEARERPPHLSIDEQSC